MRAPFRRLGLGRSASFEPLERRCLLASLDLELSERPIDADQVLSAAFTPSVSNRFGSGVGLEGVRRTYGLTGQGQTVAVIDTGIAYDQTALGGGFGEGRARGDAPRGLLPVEASQSNAGMSIQHVQGSL